MRIEGSTRSRRSQSNLLIVVLSILAVGLLAVLVAVLARKRSSTPAAPPGPAVARPEPPKPVEPPVEAPKPKEPAVDDRFATPQSVVEGYLEARYWEERLPYVLDPAKVRDRMEARYGRQELLVRSEYEVLRSYPLGEGGRRVMVEVQFKPRPGSDRKEFKQRYYVREQKQGYRIDWMASLGLNDLTWDEFRELMPRKRRPFRVEAVLPERPLPDRFDGFTALNFWKVLLIDRESLTRRLELVAYLDKRSSEGQRIYELLRDGEPHRLIVELFYDARAQDGRGPVRIGRLVAKDWVRGDEAAGR